MEICAGFHPAPSTPPNFKKCSSLRLREGSCLLTVPFVTSKTPSAELPIYYTLYSQRLLPAGPTPRHRGTFIFEIFTAVSQAPCPSESTWKQKNPPHME